MERHQSEDELIQKTHNTARFFVENRQIAWVLLVATLIWGVVGFRSMPQRKDPDVAAREAAVLCPWTGASAEKIEQLVTRTIEARIAENSKIERITSNTRTGMAVVIVRLDEDVKPANRAKEFDDIRLKLDDIHNLPEGAGPITFVKDFGDVATLLLTVASPHIDEVEIGLRSAAIRSELERVRQAATVPGQRLSILFGFSAKLAPDMLHAGALHFAHFAEAEGVLRDAQVFQGSGFLGLDAVSTLDEGALSDYCLHYLEEHQNASEVPPDTWGPFIVRDPSQVEATLRAAGANKYTYRELADYVDVIVRTLRAVPEVSKVVTAGTLREQIDLNYSQERLASYGIEAGKLPDLLGARNIQPPGGVVQAGDRNLRIDASGEFHSEQEIGDVLVPIPNHGAIYLRDLVEVSRTYESPPRFLHYYSRPVSAGAGAGAAAPGGGHPATATAEGPHPRTQWMRSRAITLSIQMRAGEQIARFDKAVDAKLEELEERLPADLILARTTDQPQEVEENVHLFMNSLYEAVILVVIVSLIGFWEWRSAVLMALSIPITLAMTFGMIQMLGVDLQQVSIASLIIALGLLVDDPVVAGDAIKRDLANGRPRLVASWWGPTKLAKAILYATLTNIAAYLPFLFLPGETGNFVHTLPVVIASSLVASRVVSMSFIPLLGYYLLRGKHEASLEERRKKGFPAIYSRLGGWAIDHRWKALAMAGAFLVAGMFIARGLGTQFFPKDLQYLSVVDIWLPEDATLAATGEAARHSEEIVRAFADEYGAQHPSKHRGPGEVLASVTTFLGGGGPRFASSVAPEQEQTNYAQLVIKARDKHDTAHLIAPLQQRLDQQVPGATIDVRQLESGAAIGIPLAIRISGEDDATLRRLASDVKRILRSGGKTVRLRDDWGSESFALKLDIDNDRANLAGVTNYDVAGASEAALNGSRVGALREGDKQIPIVARLQMHERAQAGDVENLYVYSQNGTVKVPLGQVSSLGYGMQTERIQRRQQFRTITVFAFPAPGLLSSDALNAAMPQLKALQRDLPSGYELAFGGEYEEQTKGFKNIAMVMLMSVVAIFMTLVIQFKSAFKPLVVFAAIPFGTMGALVFLRIMGTPFGFMAFLGVASLVGVIVSHVIVLFDFIEEAHEHGSGLREALLDAGIVRLRPVLITVGATVIALIPLAMHGGPLWEPMCYAQIGGLVVATFVTLLLVPVLYTIFVRDLKLIQWGKS